MTDDGKIVPPEVWNNRWRREELLTRRRRIRREARLPEHFQEELEAQRKYPYRLDGVLPGYQVVYRRSGWRRLETPQVDEPDFRDMDCSVRVRDAFCWIRKEGREVGAITFREIDAELVAPPNFWTAMDNDSAELSRWAAVILEAWENPDFAVFAYGPILELNEVWVEARHPASGVWKPVAHALLDRFFRRCSVLLAHVFPLEYGGRVPDGAATAPAFARRQAALIRTAERQLQLKPMPGPPGERGFMWRVRPQLDKMVEAPGYGAGWTDADED